MDTFWLYRKNNNEVPTCWKATLNEDCTMITVQYGIVGKIIRSEHYAVTQKNPINELMSKYNDKRKTGYVTLVDIKDDSCPTPLEDNTNVYLIDYLTKYLPNYRTNVNNGTLLPMLAKSYTGKVWDKISYLLGQYKINGLRCFITAFANNDMFKPVCLKFQSREGIYWNSLNNLEEYLLSVIPMEFLNKMIDENYALDGEVYLPGYDVNQINHFVKDSTCVENKLIQFWCYDVAIQDMFQSNRTDILNISFNKFIKCFNNKLDHLNNKDRFVILPVATVTKDSEAIRLRNNFLDLGFEGLILRNPNVDYQYGRRRVGYMEKFKRSTDGIFTVIDIYKENKRELPILLCRNDINSSTFETRLSNTHEYQKNVLDNKNKYIGKDLFIEFTERSGVEQLPFHIKEVRFINL